MALMMFSAGNALCLLNGTPQHIWAGPGGYALLVAGAFYAWASARSLHARETQLWQLVSAPALVAVAATWQSSAINPWCGNVIYLAAMTAATTMITFELCLAKAREHKVIRTLAISAGVTAAYYLCRTAVYAVEGPDGVLFVSYFDSATAGTVLLILLIAVSSSMSMVSDNRIIKLLRERADRDHLTGLCNRGAFMEVAGAELAVLSSRNTAAALVLADLDHFKSINDEYGHSAGDTALRAFSQACTESVRSTDLVGRYGGEEFIIFLPGTTVQRAVEVTADISRRMLALESLASFPFPTVSFGVTSSSGESSSSSGAGDLSDMIRAADEALYRAKDLGRNRAVTADHRDFGNPINT